MSLRPPSLHLMTAISIARCLPLLLLFFLTTPSAMTPPNDIVLPPLNITDSVERHHAIRSATSLHQEISVPPESTVLIEAFYTSSHPYPRLLLLVGDTVPPLVPTSRDAPPGVTGDYEAFWTKRKYAYVIIANQTRLHIRLCESQDHFAVSLNATLRISLVSPDSCPRGPDNQTCSNKGSCRGGECLCAKGYAGRYCESRVANLTNDPFDIPSEDMVIHHYNVQRNGSVAVRLYAHHDPAHGPAGHPSLFVKLAYENGGDYLRNGPPLPTIYDAKFRGRPGMHGHLPVQTIVRTNLERNDKLYIGVYNDQKHLLYIPRNHGLPAGILASYAPVTVRLEAFPCATRHVKGVRRCPATGHESWELSLTFLLLPLLLGTLTLLTMVVCVSVWAGVFRQQLFEVIHGHAPEEALSRRDKLSEAEVNAMFPAFVFTKGETAALGATGDVCCSVCLSSFEEGELLRRLACGHSYHSTCLDKWLLTNATCPRCRKSARIHGEVGRGWLVRRFIMTFVGRLHGALNWMVGYSQTRAREAPELESIEVEGLLPNREDGVLRRYVQAS